jgi:hypothetical protein
LRTAGASFSFCQNAKRYGTLDSGTGLLDRELFVTPADRLFVDAQEPHDALLAFEPLPPITRPFT